MARLIRNYNPGERVTLSEWTREHGLGQTDLSPEEALKQAVEQERQHLEEVRKQLEAQLAQIDAQSASVLDDAQMQAITLQAEAQAQGYEAGYKQGIADGHKKIESAMAETVAQIQRILNEVANQRSATVAAVESEIVALSLAIAEKIVGQIARTHEETIVRMVSRAIAELPNTGPMLVRIHPDDAKVIETFWQSYHKNDEESNGWRLVADPDIERGGCLLICGSTTIDARLITQFENIAQGLGISNQGINSDDEIE